MPAWTTSLFLALVTEPINDAASNTMTWEHRYRHSRTLGKERRVEGGGESMVQSGGGRLADSEKLFQPTQQHL